MNGWSEKVGLWKWAPEDVKRIRQHWAYNLATALEVLADIDLIISLDESTEV